MQRNKVFCLLLLAFAGFVLSYEAPENGLEVREEEEVLDRYGGRKLLQEKDKTKAAKPAKEKAKEGEAVKVTLNAALEEKKPKQKEKVKVPKETVQKAGGKSGKKKRVLDEEEDEDIKFLQEESAAAKVDASDVKASSKKTKKVSKNENSGFEVQKIDDGMEEEKTSTKEDKPTTKQSSSAKRKENESTTKTPSKQKKKKTAVHVEVDEKENDESSKPAEDEETSEPVQVEIIPDDEDEIVDLKLEDKVKGKSIEEELLNDSEEEQVLETKVKKPSGKSGDTKDKVVKKSETKEKVKKAKEEVKKSDDDTEGNATEVIASKKPAFPSAKKTPVQEAKTNSTKAKDKQKPDKQVNKPKPDSIKPKKSNAPKKNTGVGRKDDTLTTEKPEKKEAKTEEHMPVKFTDGVAHDVEDLHTDAGLTKPGTDLLNDLDEEEEVDFIDAVTKLPSKFQETAGNVADTLRPSIQKLSERSKTYISSANQQMTESFTPIVGEQVAPVIASLFTYALLLMPLIATVYVFERIRATLSLAKVLFFGNVYLGIYFVTLVLAAFALHSEPMAFVFKNSHSSCVLLQLLQALGYLIYLLLYTVMFFKSCSNSGLLDRLAAGFQWTIVALFGLHYYVTVFHRAMAMKVPRTTWKVYLVYSSAFAVLALFARAKIEPSKKEYYYSTDDPDEAIPVDKRS